MRNLFQVDPLGYFWAALLILLVPLNWLSAAFFAAAFHEFCHITSILLLKNKIYEIHIGTGGTIIRTETLSPAQELVCAAAGPLGSFLLFLLYHSFPKIAICAGVQCFFNLLPIPPLDGGRVLRSGLEILFPGFGYRISKMVEWIVISLLIISSIFIIPKCFPGELYAVAAIMLLIKTFLRKIPCKQP